MAAAARRISPLLQQRARQGRRSFGCLGGDLHFHRRREQEALHGNRPALTQQGQLPGAFDAFGHHFQSQSMAQGDHRAGDCGRARAAINALNQGTVELHARDRQLRQ
jgi:hypothetical protein